MVRVRVRIRLVRVRVRVRLGSELAAKRAGGVTVQRVGAEGEVAYRAEVGEGVHYRPLELVRVEPQVGHRPHAGDTGEIYGRCSGDMAGVTVITREVLRNPSSIVPPW